MVKKSLANQTPPQSNDSNQVFTDDMELARTSLRLPKDMMKELRLIAAETGTTQTNIIIEAMNDYFQKIGR